mmetsp:Transcript_2121/g.5378  ORF Transcript_2121/g.5378 Transcript_2121/m.5378 type:complete len:415 (-) Transcript_2121:818-2062(-)
MTGYLAASCSSTARISRTSRSSARSRSDSLGASCAGRGAGSRSVLVGRGRPRCRALLFFFSSAAARSASSLSRRALMSAASSSSAPSASIASSGSSGATSWYSFWGAGSELRPARTSLRSAARRACSARRLSVGIPYVARLSASFRPSSSRMGVRMGVAPGMPAPGAPGPRSGVPATDGVLGTPAMAVPAAPRRTDMPAAPAPAPGVMATASGLGVAATVGRGVTPEKSEGFRSGFSPPMSGVVRFCSLARFCASMRMRSPEGAVRTGVGSADAKRAGVGPYWPSSPRVASPPAPSIISSSSSASVLMRAICSSSVSDTWGAGSIMRPRRRTMTGSFSSAALATASGALCVSCSFWRLTSRLTSCSSMSRRRRPSSSSTVTGRNSCCSSLLRICSSDVSKKPEAGFFSNATSAL